MQKVRSGKKHGVSHRYCAWADYPCRAVERELFSFFGHVECAGGRTNYNRMILRLPKTIITTRCAWDLCRRRAVLTGQTGTIFRQRQPGAAKGTAAGITIAVSPRGNRRHGAKEKVRISEWRQNAGCYPIRPASGYSHRSVMTGAAVC